MAEGSSDIDTRVLQAVQQNEEGASDSLLAQLLPDTELGKRVAAYNRLLQAGKLSLLKSGSEYIYKYKTKEEGGPSGDSQERLVFQIVSAAGNKGIWCRDVRLKTNLSVQPLNKIFQNLVSRKLIKSVKHVKNAKKKVYMLYDLQPDKSVTGGPWYSDQGFESEYVDVLTNQCHRFLQNKYEDACGKHTDPITIKNSSYASVEEICEYISALGISKVKLSADDMGMVMDALMYDNKVERSFDPSNQEALYKVVNSPLNSTPMVKVPCGVCPVAAQCEIGGIVSPSNCIYLDDWLTF